MKRIELSETCEVQCIHEDAVDRVRAKMPDEDPVYDYYDSLCDEYFDDEDESEE